MNKTKEKAGEEIFDVARKMGESANKVQGYVAEIKQLLFEYTKSIEEIGNIPERTCDNCYYDNSNDMTNECTNPVDDCTGEHHKFAHEIDTMVEKGRSCHNCVYCHIVTDNRHKYHCSYRNDIRADFVACLYWVDKKPEIDNRNCFNCRLYENCFTVKFRNSDIFTDMIKLIEEPCNHWEKKND